ncbi:hypothetical protein ACFQZE_16290 [Paenibacillus sp. GCM10027627]|uniref:hypothetical protein n=1 Tax=unclassified Paenibacillus TaxID=185978 RepID=UPI00363D6227
MRQAVFYEMDGETGIQLPVWLMLDDIGGEQWNSALYILFEAPFERFLFHELDQDVMALSVPDHVYVKDRDNPFAIGIHMPALKSYANRMMAASDDYYSEADLSRLMLRISDIEDILQLDVRAQLSWETAQTD